MYSITGIINSQLVLNFMSAVSPFNGLKPFDGFWSFVLVTFITVFFIYFYTSVLYWLLRVFIANAKDNKYGTAQFFILFFGLLGSIVVYLSLKSCLHSLKIDSFGAEYYLLAKGAKFPVPAADSLLAAAVLGSLGCWIRIYQILFIEDISERYFHLVKILPYLSSFTVMGLITGLWYFYSNIWDFWWYIGTFYFIFGMIVYHSYSHFKQMLQMKLSQSYEFEENLSKKNISIAVGIILISIIVIVNINTLPRAYLFAPFFILAFTAAYLLPGRFFRQLKRFPRYSSVSARVMYFTKFTRSILLLWTIILFVLGLILSFGMHFDSGFSNPYKNYETCRENVKLMGESMEQYMEQNNGFLPNSISWTDHSWLHKITEDKKIKYIPSCPSGGVYQYRKWRNEKGIPLYEIRCSGHVHNKAGVSGFYPRYVRKKGVIDSPAISKPK